MSVGNWVRRPDILGVTSVMVCSDGDNFWLEDAATMVCSDQRPSHGRCLLQFLEVKAAHII